MVKIFISKMIIQRKLSGASESCQNQKNTIDPELMFETYGQML